MTVQLGGKPLAGFDQPLEMLADCHRRIEHFLDVLQKVERLYAARPLDAEARRALEAALAYFANFAPRHTADEEDSLFPRMRAHPDPEVQNVMRQLDQLEEDHRQTEIWHAEVDRLVRGWLEEGQLTEPKRRTLNQLLANLTACYQAHIRLEEEAVFTLASKVLAQQELTEIGVEMKRRRGLNDSRPPGI